MPLFIKNFEYGKYNACKNSVCDSFAILRIVGDSPIAPPCDMGAENLKVIHMAVNTGRKYPNVFAIDALRQGVTEKKVDINDMMAAPG